MDYIESDQFLAVGKELPDGHSVRIDHDCIGQSSGTLMVSRNGNKVSAYCFRCGASGFHATQESLAERVARLKAEAAADAAALESVCLPEPAVHDLREWPSDAKLWLYKYGFSPAMIERLGAYWCPAIGRVVLPIMRDGHAIFWQARSVRRTPKILSPKAPRNGVVARYGSGDPLVLCEDTLSAFKVGRETEAWSLLGTKLLPGPMAEIVQANRPVVVWLDSDRPGQDGARTIINALRARGVSTTNIITPSDPKAYDAEKIRELLCTR